MIYNICKSEHLYLAKRILKTLCNLSPGMRNVQQLGNHDPGLEHKSFTFRKITSVVCSQFSFSPFCVIPYQLTTSTISIALSQAHKNQSYYWQQLSPNTKNSIRTIMFFNITHKYCNMLTADCAYNLLSPQLLSRNDLVPDHAMVLLTTSTYVANLSDAAFN